MQAEFAEPVVSELVATEPTHVENARLSFTLKLCSMFIFAKIKTKLLINVINHF